MALFAALTILMASAIVATAVPQPRSDPARGTPTKCRKIQYELCGQLRNDPEACMRCISVSWNITGFAGCTIADDEQFCKVSPGEVTCVDALERACGNTSPSSNPNSTKCAACLKDHHAAANAANCTADWEREYCHPWPASRECQLVQLRLCGRTRSSPETKLICRPFDNVERPKACMECIGHNWNATGAAHCSIPDDEQFCQVKPAEVKCIDALEEACGAKPPPALQCERCVEDHANKTKAAGCTSAWEITYCGAKPKLGAQ